MTLSKKQRELLKHLITGKTNNSFSKHTYEALERKGYLGEDRKLTRTGKVKSLELIPLKEQCCHLPVDLIEFKVGSKSLSNPELKAYRWFKKQGYIGTYCEGGSILIALKALTLDKLTEYNTFNSREDACTRYLEAQYDILSDQKTVILESIASTGLDTFISNFSEIISYQTIQQRYPSLTINFGKQFIRSVDRRVFVSVADKLFDNPYEYRKGWPDLTLIK